MFEFHSFPRGETYRNKLHRYDKSLIPVNESFDSRKFEAKLRALEQTLGVGEGHHVAKQWVARGQFTRGRLYLPLEKMQKPPNINNVERFGTDIRSGGPDRIRTGDLLRDRQTC